MTVKPTVSLTDHAYQFAKALVENGKYASISSVVQRGLMLVEEEEAEVKARLEALRHDLDVRAAGPKRSLQEFQADWDAWRAERKAARDRDSQ